MPKKASRAAPSHQALRFLPARARRPRHHRDLEHPRIRRRRRRVALIHRRDHPPVRPRRHRRTSATTSTTSSPCSSTSAALGPRVLDFIPDAGGNHERLGFLFDTSTIEHTGLASQACPPRKRIDSEYLPQIGWWGPRSSPPSSAAAASAMPVTAHIRWAGDDEMARLPEIEAPGRLGPPTLPGGLAPPRDAAALGDFNIRA